MPDFFISYTSPDRKWAEWIAYVLEEEGFEVIIQAWDFRPGSNFVLEMQKAATEADRTIMVLSPDYLKSQFASPEWAAAFRDDPQGLERKLIPIVVRRCSPSGLLAPLVHISLIDEDEDRARDLLIGGVKAKRAKPSQRPAFPGAAAKSARKAFPGPSGSAPYMPKLKRAATDVEKRRFVRQTFDTIKEHFESGLDQLGARNDGIECEFQPSNATDFTAEVFVNGKTRCRCRIWQGGIASSDGISYYEGQSFHGTNATNEVLSISDQGGELHLVSLMGDMGFGRIERDFDLKHMTPEQAADYLWRRFLLPLER
jgi:TIR domain